jgi:hypothetical protein
MSTALQNRQQGERLEQLDPPSLPQTPAQPKRPLMISIGSGFGFLLGLCLAGVKETRNRALHNAKDIRGYSPISVLGNIGLFESAETVRRRRRAAWFTWSAGCVVGIAIMFGSVAHYYATKL